MTFTTQQDENGNCPTCGRSMRLSPEMETALEVHESDTKPVVPQNAPDLKHKAAPQENARMPDTIWADSDGWTDDGGTPWSEEYTSKTLTDALNAHHEERFNQAADVQDAAISKRDARIAELEAFVRSIANPDNWLDEVANLQWMGKRHAIEYAKSMLKTPKGDG